MEKVDCDNSTLVAHPSAFLTRTVDGIPEIGSLISEDKLSCHFNMRLSREPMCLTDNLIFLGEIKRTNDFEAVVPIGKILRDGMEEDDYVLYDSALVYASPEGMVILRVVRMQGSATSLSMQRRSAAMIGWLT